MNFFDLSNEMRIKLLKVVIGAQLFNAAAMMYYIRELKKGSDDKSKLLKIQHKAIKQFAENCNDVKLLDKIATDYQFDWLVKDMKEDE